MWSAAGRRCAVVPVSDRDSPVITVRSGAQRARRRASGLDHPCGRVAFVVGNGVATTRSRRNGRVASDLDVAAACFPCPRAVALRPSNLGVMV